MPRIRSIHPSIWTDERFVSVSIPARLFWFGLETQADDQGIFEWKLLSLKMTLYPACGVDIAGLMSELVDADLVRSYEVAGKRFGAIWEFRARQRPKKPNYIHPMPPEFETYTGPGGGGSPPVPHRFRTDGENRPQMEDGGGEEDGGDRNRQPAATADPPRIGAPPPPPAEQLIEQFDKAVRLTWREAGPRRRAHSDQQVAAELVAAGVPPAEFFSFALTWLAEWSRKRKDVVGSLALLRPDALAWASRRGEPQGRSGGGTVVNWDQVSAGADKLAGVA